MMTQAEALMVLKTGANVFLTGEPGSGKTHTINRYVSWLHEHGIEPAITASTGIAATHIGGMTIHAWSGIGVRRDLTRRDVDQIAQNKRVYERVSEAHVLIIDEVSMLSAAVLSMVDAVCREIRRVQAPFGGLQVILVGDFFQLPPVVRETEAQASFEEPDVDDVLPASKSLFAFSSPSWASLNPLVCYISEQHRQEDVAFLGLLSAIRRGGFGETHRVLLRTRYSKEPGAGITQLYSHNAAVDRINDAALGDIPGAGHTYTMTGRGAPHLVEALKRGCLSPEVLKLKEGARVMFTRNDILGRYVNGTLGTVSGFAPATNYPIVKTYAGRTITAEPDEWTIQDGGKILARIGQIPLRLSWAMTVHKSQGMSLDAAHMDLSQVFEYGQGYVALSRVRTLAGLSLAGLNSRATEVHPEVKTKDEYFRAASERVRETFVKMSAADVSKLHSNFIRACGGVETPRSPVAPAHMPEVSSVTRIRKTHPKAYTPWEKEDDSDLKRRHTSGEKPAAIAKAMSRRTGAIHARLKKLGLAG